VSNLRSGDVLVGHDRQRVRVESVRDTGEYGTVYNLRVRDWHTYFVGTAEWGWDAWAHNAGCTPEQAAERISLLRGLLFDDNIPKSARHREAIHAEIAYLETFTNGNFQTAQHVQNTRNGPVTRTVYKNTVNFDGGVPPLVDASVEASVAARLKNGYTNKRLIEEGAAPIGSDGKQINLHHLLGKEPGPMIELTTTRHELYGTRLHDMIENGSGVHHSNKVNEAYKRFKRSYWKARANDF
jgi:hypothetical protein